MLSNARQLLECRREYAASLLSTSRFLLFPPLVSSFSLLPFHTRSSSFKTDLYPSDYPLFRLPRVPESLLKKRKTAEKYAVEKAIQNVEKKKVRRLPLSLIIYICWLVRRGKLL